MCGENLLEARKVIRWEGSPPRVRGKHNMKNRSCRTKRITPACAGKTAADAAGETVSGDHPRVCGENTSEMAYFRG